MNSKSNTKQDKPQNKRRVRGSRWRDNQPMSLEKAMELTFNAKGRPTEMVYLTAQKRIMNAFYKDKERFLVLGQHLINGKKILENDYEYFIKFNRFATNKTSNKTLPRNNLLDVKPSFPLEVEDQQSTEREDMSESYKSDSDPQVVPHSKRAISDMPNPSLTPQASANRKKKPANLRLYDDFLKEVDAAASEAGTTRTSWIEEALTEKLARQRKNTPS